MCPRLLKFYQIGEISPNLITLSAFSFPVKVGRYMAFLETIEVCGESRTNLVIRSIDV